MNGYTFRPNMDFAALSPAEVARRKLGLDSSAQATEIARIRSSDSPSADNRAYLAMLLDEEDEEGAQSRSRGQVRSHHRAQNRAGNFATDGAQNLEQLEATLGAPKKNAPGSAANGAANSAPAPKANAKLPKEYNFFEAYPGCRAPAWDQNQCGSCYAFSVVGSLGYRVCQAQTKRGDANPFNSRLSPQQVVSCATTNGCKGGALLQAFKDIASMKRVVPYSCSGYLSFMGNRRADICDKMESCCENRGLPVAKMNMAIKYIFDEEPNNQERLMRDIFENGPIAAGVTVTNAFISGFTGDGVFRWTKMDAFLNRENAINNSNDHAIGTNLYFFFFF